MLDDIINIACPNRFVKQGIKEQICYGDTDSLIMRRWQVDLLCKKGLIKEENGCLVDDLQGKVTFSNIKDVSSYKY